MQTVNHILDALWALAPQQLAFEWDNVGLMCGHSNGSVQGVLVALDPTPAVAAEAQEAGCQLVVTHHPLWGKMQRITDGDLNGRLLLSFLERGLALISMHTNLDRAVGGVNDVLAQTLGLQDIQLLPEGEHLIRQGTAPRQTLPEFAAQVKRLLSCSGLRYVSGGKPVEQVAVGGGACTDYIPQVLAAGCDTFVTADAKYHDLANAAAMGLNLIDAGHFETENPVCGVLAQHLRQSFPDIQVSLSQGHRDPICWL